MSIIKSDYRKLQPSLKLLTDVTVLAQAWKKSHTYIRRHNWYADVLELDISAVNLEQRLETWSAELKDGNFKPSFLRVVPAPKNRRWTFTVDDEKRASKDIWNNVLGDDPSFDDWRPKQDANGVEDQPLRPLAHVGVRDQVLCTAAMLCLANAIETEQGDPGLDIMVARKRGVVSYGNRLHCQWRHDGVDESKLAEFSWGSSRTYSDYFEHYQTFLSRPAKVCAELSGQVGHDKELFVVKLDLASFFDCVDRDALLRELRRLDECYRSRTGEMIDESDDGDLFWLTLKKLFAWSWNKSDEKEYGSLFQADSKYIGSGLPQGLVASGFLANAYMCGLDQMLVEALVGRSELNTSVSLLDYCRYVDDIRIVVSASANIRTTEQLNALRELVEDFIQEKISTHLKMIDAAQNNSLNLNKNKSEIQAYRAMSQQGGLSALMRQMNAGLSGTFDLESLMEATGGLDGLLWLSEQLGDEDSVKPSRLKLAAISPPTRDVRDDTVKRFVATRLVKVLRERLVMADGDSISEDAWLLDELATTGKAMAHEFETTARKLIKVWSENPSLVLLLRCGLDLFPHPRLLEPVLDALEVKLSPSDETDKTRCQILAAQYVIADLLRAGAIETGHRDGEAYPLGVDIQGYRRSLSILAKRMVHDAECPWYVKQQSYLYLSSISDISTNIVFKDVKPELRPYLRLQKALRYQSVNPVYFLRELPLALVVQQIRPDVSRFTSWFVNQLELDDFDDHAAVIDMLALNSPDLLMACLAIRSSGQRKWVDCVPSGIRILARENGLARSKKPLPAKTTLLRVFANRHNPFESENAVLALVRAFLMKVTASTPGDSSETNAKAILEALGLGLTAEHIELECNDWSAVDRLVDEGLTVINIDHKNMEGWQLYAPPPWVVKERAWLYGLGRILRSAMTGELDFTARKFLIQEEISRYSGLRSTWFQRRFGLLNSSSGLLQEPAPITPWLSGFLTGLLQWPGTFVREPVAQEVSKVKTPHELLKIVETRIKGQHQLYGHRSKTPFYVMPTSDKEPEFRPMRVAVVQTLRPKLREFDTKDPLHWTPADMAAHRRHLAEMCRLTQTKVKAWASSRDRMLPSDREGPLVDLVLFPELSVHEEHIGFLRRLSDKLKANIFAGLTFVHSAKAGGITNQGLWVIRTQFEGDGRRYEYVRQGKKFPMRLEEPMGVKPFRPHMTLVEFPIGRGTPTRVAAAICYDATDLELVADLRERSDVFLVAAMNQDVQTFDNMVNALHFHMYQPVILANSGEFGGSTAQAPFPKHERTISHVHGGNQVAVSVFEVEPWHFKDIKSPISPKSVKTPPAGYKGR